MCAAVCAMAFATDPIDVFKYTPELKYKQQGCEDLDFSHMELLFEGLLEPTFDFGASVVSDKGVLGLEYLYSGVFNSTTSTLVPSVVDGVQLSSLELMYGSPTSSDPHYTHVESDQTQLTQDAIFDFDFEEVMRETGPATLPRFALEPLSEAGWANCGAPSGTYDTGVSQELDLQPKFELLENMEHMQLQPTIGGLQKVEHKNGLCASGYDHSCSTLVEHEYRHLPHKSPVHVFNGATVISTKSPKQHYSSPPKRSHAIGKVRPRRGSNNDIVKHTLDYSAAQPIPTIAQETTLVNFASLPLERPIEELVKPILVEFQRDDEAAITNIRRTRFIRGSLEGLNGLHEDIRYEKNPCFSIERPYEPEFISYQVDKSNNLPYNETRSGLCPYCPEIKFRNFKTSTYSQHLALWHGIHTDNYLTPNPSHFGVYRLCKNRNLETRKTQAHSSNKKGVVCPVCHEVIEVGCSKATRDKPLSGYLRHFRDAHRRSNQKADIDQYFNLSKGLDTK
jgi:hypothetical protein